MRRWLIPIGLLSILDHSHWLRSKQVSKSNTMAVALLPHWPGHAQRSLGSAFCITMLPQSLNHLWGNPEPFQRSTRFTVCRATWHTWWPWAKPSRYYNPTSAMVVQRWLEPITWFVGWLARWLTTVITNKTWRLEPTSGFPSQTVNNCHYWGSWGLVVHQLGNVLDWWI